MGFLKCLFPVCFFWCFSILANIDNQYFTTNQQFLKKKIMMVVCAASFSTMITILSFFLFPFVISQIYRNFAANNPNSKAQ